MAACCPDHHAVRPDPFLYFLRVVAAVFVGLASHSMRKEHGLKMIIKPKLVYDSPSSMVDQVGRSAIEQRQNNDVFFYFYF